MKHSAGILIYKKDNDDIKILLCHPGGPFWKNKNLHSWSIPKGEVEDNERMIDTAIREFKEETNLDVTCDNLEYLGSHKVSHRKIVTIFYKEGDYDLSNCFSNTFEREYGGRMCEFPENDKFEWIRISDAYELIFKSQIFFLERLEQSINNKN